MSMCPKCDGKGFEELEHGLIMVACELCDGTGEIGEDKASQYYKEAKALADVLLPLPGEIDDSSIGTEPDNQPVGGDNPSQPKLKRQSKKAKKARARTG